MKFAVIGKNSFLARAIKKRAPKEWVFLSHDEALSETGWLEGVTGLVNFAFHPSLRANAIAPETDIDARLARIIADRRIHYIAPSSRLAYGRPSSGMAMKENDEAALITPYGENKLAIERTLTKILGPERVTILRLSNIFGLEPGRSTFMGMAQTRLWNEGRILYDISPKTLRDFLFVDRFSDMFLKISARPKAGIYNLGAGFGVETGLIAEWLIEGYGAGELAVRGSSLDDQFWLDMAKTKAAFDVPMTTLDDLRRDCVACGQKLKAMKQEVALK